MVILDYLRNRDLDVRLYSRKYPVILANLSAVQGEYCSGDILI